MTVATVAIIVEGLLLVVALVFVVALLRSHAEILRRLTQLERSPAGLRPPGVRPEDGESGTVAADLAGETLAGDAVKIGLGPGSPRTLLAFLSSGCAACGPLWSGLHQPLPLPGGARLVVVTKSPDRERLARLLELAPADVELVMSTEAWEAFAVPATPHFVLVGGERGILGRGSAASWQQIAGLLKDADDDDALYRARTTDERAARAEQALAAAGIGAGHPSLYPSRLDPRTQSEDE